MATTGVSTHQFDDAVLRGRVKSAARHKLKTKDMVYKKCGFKTMDSTGPWEEYVDFTGIALLPRKEEFGQVANDVPKQNYVFRINNLAYAVQIPMSEEAIRALKAGKTNVMSFIRPAELVAEACLRTKEVIAADVFANAFDTNYVGRDGKPLISTTHTLGRGGSASNHLGAVSISQEALEAAIIQGRKMPDDVGLPVGVGDEEKILVIQEDSTFDVDRILNSTLQSDNANNAKNALKGKNIRPQANPYLASTSNWFLINTGVDLGLIEQVETAEDVRDFGDDKTHTKYTQIYMNVGFGFFEWRGVQGSNF
jgi:hypothetical protein